MTVAEPTYRKFLKGNLKKKGEKSTWLRCHVEIPPTFYPMESVPSTLFSAGKAFPFEAKNPTHPSGHPRRVTHLRGRPLELRIEWSPIRVTHTHSPNHHIGGGGRFKCINQTPEGKWRIRLGA